MFEKVLAMDKPALQSPFNFREVAAQYLCTRRSLYPIPSSPLLFPTTNKEKGKWNKPVLLSPLNLREVIT